MGSRGERRKRLDEHIGDAHSRSVCKGSQPNSRGGAGSQPNSRGGAIIIDRILLVSAAGSRLRELAEVVVVAGSTPSSRIQPCQFLGNELVSHSSELYG